MTENLIYQKISDIMKEIGVIGKTQRNTQQGFMYRGIDDVYGALQPLLAKHEVFTTTEVTEERSEERETKKGGTLIYRILKIAYTFFTTDGSSVRSVVVGEGMDSGDKAANKAMAVGHKYALLQIFCIPTEDMKDPDAESHEVTFKKKTVVTERSTGAGNPKDKELSKKQWDFIKSIGKKGFGLSEEQVIEFVKWTAKKHKLSPRSYKISEILLPAENFNTEYAFYSKFLIDGTEASEEPPFPGDF